MFANKIKTGLIQASVIFAVFLFFAPARVLPQEAAAPAEGEEKITASTDMELQISTRPEAKLSLRQSFVFPFLRGQGALTRGNNIKTTLGAYVTPVSVAGFGEIDWTPVAFLFFSGGGQAASGWTMPLGRGIGLKTPETDTVPDPADDPRAAVYSGDFFNGVVWNAWGAGTFQFDLAALVPGAGDWTHVQFQTRQEFRYSTYSEADSGDFWIYEQTDDLDMLNGWNYRASYTLAYSMSASPVLDTVGIIAELNKPLYPDLTINGKNSGEWGMNLGKWIFTSFSRFGITEDFGVTLALQFRTLRNFGDGIFNNKKQYYPDYTLDSTEGERRILFYRVALMLNYKIR